MEALWGKCDQGSKEEVEHRRIVKRWRLGRIKISPLCSAARRVWNLTMTSVEKDICQIIIFQLPSLCCIQHVEYLGVAPSSITCTLP
ncbi:hypothetical protein FRC02_012089 [Tulasnella sp. 418]|nr:hypothetical protein FRC02_012089 [Tulasnella sp. 418]